MFRFVDVEIFMFSDFEISRCPNDVVSSHLSIFKNMPDPENNNRGGLLSVRMDPSR